MPKDLPTATDWRAVTARALAFQAMHLAGLGDKGVTEKAQFLMGLGLSRADAAQVLGSSDDSLRIMLGRGTKKEVAAAPKPRATAK